MFKYLYLHHPNLGDDDMVEAVEGYEAAFLNHTFSSLPFPPRLLPCSSLSSWSSTDRHRDLRINPLDVCGEKVSAGVPVLIVVATVLLRRGDDDGGDGWTVCGWRGETSELALNKDRLNDHINLPLRNVSLWYLFK